MICDCRGTGVVYVDERSVKPCVCAITNLRLAALGARFIHASFDGLEGDLAKYGVTPHATMLAARDRMAAAPRGSYFICGDFAAWKTYLAASQFNALLDSLDTIAAAARRIRFLSDRDLFRSLRNHELGTGHAQITPDEILAGKMDHLLIDDLGKQTVSDFVRRSYYELFDAVFRAAGSVGLTITANYGLAGLAYDREDREIYEPAMVRRIEHCCEVLEVKR